MRKSICFKVKKRIAAVLLAAVMLIPGSGSAAFAHNLSDTEFEQVDGTIIYISAGASATTGSQVSYYWKVPLPVLKSMVSDGIKIYIDTEKEESGTLRIYGLAPTDNTIYAGLYQYAYIDILSDSSVTTDGFTMIHEIGHYVDNCANGGRDATGTWYNSSSNEKWNAIYSAEASAIGSISSTSSLNVYSPCEAFATAFADYVLYPQKLKSAAPQAYSYIDSCISTF